MKSKKIIFKSAVTTLVLCIFLGLFVAERASKDKTSFNKSTGVLIGIDNFNENFAGKDTSKFRYLQISSYSKPFQIFIGKSKGDFKPTLEKINNLKIGDSIVVYFDEDNKTQNSPVNNLAYFIDKGKEAVFIKGNFEKYLGYGIAIFCGVFILLLIFLKMKQKIL